MINNTTILLLYTFLNCVLLEIDSINGRLLCKLSCHILIIQTQYYTYILNDKFIH